MVGSLPWRQLFLSTTWSVASSSVHIDFYGLLCSTASRRRVHRPGLRRKMISSGTVVVVILCVKNPPPFTHNATTTTAPLHCNDPTARLAISRLH
jgi:hypothetical protein